MGTNPSSAFWDRRQENEAERARQEVEARRRRLDLRPLNKGARVLLASKHPRIPLLSGRPNRETVICKDDILNLRIALDTAKDYDAFVAMV